MIILVGDIGGIHSRIAYYEFDTSRLKFLVEEIYPSVQYTDWTGESSRIRLPRPPQSKI
jgi:hypothetical protein